MRKSRNLRSVLEADFNKARKYFTFTELLEKLDPTTIFYNTTVFDRHSFIKTLYHTSNAIMQQLTKIERDNAALVLEDFNCNLCGKTLARLFNVVIFRDVGKHIRVKHLFLDDVLQRMKYGGETDNFFYKVFTEMKTHCIEDHRDGKIAIKNVSNIIPNLSIGLAETPDETVTCPYFIEAKIAGYDHFYPYFGIIGVGHFMRHNRLPKVKTKHSYIALLAFLARLDKVLDINEITKETFIHLLADRLNTIPLSSNTRASLITIMEMKKALLFNPPELVAWKFIGDASISKNNIKPHVDDLFNMIVANGYFSAKKAKSCDVDKKEIVFDDSTLRNVVKLVQLTERTNTAESFRRKLGSLKELEKYVYWKANPDLLGFTSKNELNKENPIYKALLSKIELNLHVDPKKVIINFEELINKIKTDAGSIDHIVITNKNLRKLDYIGFLSSPVNKDSTPIYIYDDDVDNRKPDNVVWSRIDYVARTTELLGGRTDFSVPDRLITIPNRTSDVPYLCFTSKEWCITTPEIAQRLSSIFKGIGLFHENLKPMFLKHSTAVATYNSVSKLENPDNNEAVVLFCIQRKDLSLLQSDGEQLKIKIGYKTENEDIDDCYEVEYTVV